VLAGEDEQGPQHDGGPGGVEAQAGEDPPVLVAEAVLDGGARGGQGLVSLPLGGCGLAGPGGFVAGDGHFVVVRQVPIFLLNPENSLPVIPDYGDQ
jgi:hypothetical protein